MEDTKLKYYEVKEYREMLSHEIKDLENYDVVKKYIELNDKAKLLEKKEKELYESFKNKEYDACDHVLVNTKIVTDVYDGDVYEYPGCIKCGLDSEVLCNNSDLLPMDKKVMYDYIIKHGIEGFKTHIACDMDLASSIYTKIKEAHPDIDDELAVKYFDRALTDIREKKVSEERKISRAKRLVLKPQFKKWQSRDVNDDYDCKM